MKHAERFGLDVPDDFPLEAIEAIHAHVSRDEEARARSEWREWASAVNGLLWRFKACDEHGAALIESLRTSAGPPVDARYQQEKWLFAFFTEGLSSIECLFYGLYFIGAVTDPRTFDAEIKGRDVNPGLVVARFSEAFPSDELTTRLAEVHGGEELELWREVRNVLAHRGAPPRHHFSSGPSLWDLSAAASRLLEPEQIAERRERVGAAVGAIAKAASPFVHARVS